MRTKVLNHFHTFHPEAQAEFDRLVKVERDLSRAVARQGDDESPTPRRRASEPLPAAGDVAAELADVRAHMDQQRAIIASGVVRIHIKGLTRGEFRRLHTEHPPRDDDSLDVQLGYNADTFGDELIKRCILRTESLDGEPVENEWARWADDMTNGQWEEVFRACLSLTNDGEPTFPR